ncbi:MAG: DUF455 family protein [Myxococcales bacterium]|nr:DUF455 family protein [Myxococcales bacterium]MDD9964902.1 DUF455 family protein [Myxococcales bacterium]
MTGHATFVRTMWSPQDGTIEAWAHRYVTSDELPYKLSPPPPPKEWDPSAEPLVLTHPGRPEELTLAGRGTRTPGRDALRRPERRAQLLHTFLHHELQAAELMCRTLLAFPAAPRAFRQGLLSICQDELRHMEMYAEHIERLGFRFGGFPVNDWFWRRVPETTTALQFVALMGLGFEGANLDHTARFAERFDQAGDARGADVQRRIGQEEIPHVAFGVYWFEKLGHAPLTFDTWRAALPSPLSPILMRGNPIDREARARAGMSGAFTEALFRFQPTQ